MNAASMITESEFAALIRRSIPDADVRIVDRTGTMDHFDVFVRSSAFGGKSLLDRHRMVEAAAAPARADGRVHAMAITTEQAE